MTKREIILDKTLELIAKQGIQATPMSLIAREAGIAIGTIYHYFHSKDEILNEIYLSKKKDFQVLISQSLNDQDPLALQFANLWKSIHGYYISNPFIFRFIQQLGSTSIINQNTREAGQKYYSGIQEFLKKGMVEGKFVDMDVQLLTELLHGSICTLVDLEIKGEIPGTPKNIEDGILFSWRAILKY